MCISMWIMWITKRKPVCMGSSDVDNFWGRQRGRREEREIGLWADPGNAPSELIINYVYNDAQEEPSRQRLRK